MSTCRIVQPESSPSVRPDARGTSALRPIAGGLAARRAPRQDVDVAGDLGERCYVARRLLRAGQASRQPPGRRAPSREPDRGRRRCRAPARPADRARHTVAALRRGSGRGRCRPPPGRARHRTDRRPAPAPGRPRRGCRPARSVGRRGAARRRAPRTWPAARRRPEGFRGPGTRSNEPGRDGISQRLDIALHRDHPVEDAGFVGPPQQRGQGVDADVDDGHRGADRSKWDGGSGRCRHRSRGPSHRREPSAPIARAIAPTTPDPAATVRAVSEGRSVVEWPIALQREKGSRGHRRHELIATSATARRELSGGAATIGGVPFESPGSLCIRRGLASSRSPGVGPARRRCLRSPWCCGWRGPHCAPARSAAICASNAAMGRPTRSLVAAIIAVRRRGGIIEGKHLSRKGREHLVSGLPQPGLASARPVAVRARSGSRR